MKTITGNRGALAHLCDVMGFTLPSGNWKKKSIPVPEPLYARALEVIEAYTPPSIVVYTYGAKPPLGDGRKECLRQLKLANEYQNKLIEIERDRRKCFAEWRLETFPNFAKLVGEEALLSQEESLCRKQIKKERAKARGRSLSKEAQEQVATWQGRLKELKAELSPLREALKTSRKEIREQEKTAEVKAFDAAAKDAIKAARTSFSKEKGLRWGTYLTREHAVEAAKTGKPGNPCPPEGPRFKPYRGEGFLAVQIQKGLPVEDALACKGTNLRVEMTGTSKGGRRPFGLVWFRVGSEGKGNRKPIWVKIPIVYHRPLPPGSQIMWAKLVRTMTANQEKWEVQFTVKTEPKKRARDANAVCSVKLGWRHFPGKGLRVAVTSEGEELFLPYRNSKEEKLEALDRLMKAHELQSVRETKLNNIRETLLAIRPKLSPTLQEFLKKGKGLSQWKQAGQFVMFLRAWDEYILQALAKDYNMDLSDLLDPEKRLSRTERLEVENRLKAAGWNGDKQVGGDDYQIAYQALVAWEKKDRHLWQMEAGMRKRAQRQRREIYRLWADKLCSTHKKIIVEDLDLAQMVKIPKAEDPVSLYQVARRNRTYAALSHLVGSYNARAGRWEGGALPMLAARYGTELIPADPKKAVQICSCCGEETDVGAFEVNYACDSCQEEWDRSHNAASNLLTSTKKAPKAVWQHV